MKILITGGAGYIGTSLLPMLLNENNDITVYDSLLFANGDKLVPYIHMKNFNFIKGDIRDEELLKRTIGSHDIIIHLAALVGFPICRERGETEAFDVNTNATRLLCKHMSKGQYLLFGSTGSNYGEVIGLCTENTPLRPLSIYGKTKTEAEKIVMQRENSTAFRFATAFGLSPRLRLDLLVNDLTYKSLNEGYAVVYESHFMRTFIHVRDLCKVFLFAIENNSKMKNNVFNVGSDAMNYSKKQVCDIIQQVIPNCHFNFADIGKDPDMRNYEVSYDKISSLGYKTEISLSEGIKELVKAYSLIKTFNPYYNVVK